MRRRPLQASAGAADKRRELAHRLGAQNRARIRALEAGDQAALERLAVEHAADLETWHRLGGQRGGGR